MFCCDPLTNKSANVRAPAFTVMLALLLAMVAVGPAFIGSARAADLDGQLVTIEPHETSRLVRISLNKSLIVRLPVAARDVLVSSPTTLDAVVRSARTTYLIGLQVGQTNVFFFDDAGRQILSLDVTVERDIAPLELMLARLMPGSEIRVEALNDSLVLTGSVGSAQQSRMAVDLAARFIAPSDGTTVTDHAGAIRVVNMMSIAARDQVTLRVTIAEVQRTVLKQLGIDVAASLQLASTIVNFTSLNPFTIGNGLLSGTNLNATHSSGGSTVGGIIRAMERDGLLRTLAEPTLTAVSGETANFLAGGEFPVPVGSTEDGITIEFKPFGVGLGFTPIVLSEGRINLKVSTEVSETTTDGFSLAGPTTSTSITIPGLRVRRASTTVELPSGGSLVMAGLIQENQKHELNGIPGIKDVPVLGTLFRSRDYQNEETELVVIITPYIVNPVHRDELVTPDQNLNMATDEQTIFMGWLNKVYGVNGGGGPDGTYHGNYGFSAD
jgi:pilus assembly protein CpaC